MDFFLIKQLSLNDCIHTNRLCESGPKKFCYVQRLKLFEIGSFAPLLLSGFWVIDWKKDGVVAWQLQISHFCD